MVPRKRRRADDGATDRIEREREGERGRVRDGVEETPRAPRR